MCERECVSEVRVSFRGENHSVLVFSVASELLEASAFDAQSRMLSCLHGSVLRSDSAAFVKG